MSETADKDLLHGALDGALTEPEADRLRDWLARDPAARAQAEDLRRLAELVLQLGPAEPPAGLSEQVMAAVTARAERGSVPWWERWTAGVRGVRQQLFEWFVHHSERNNWSGELLRWASGMAGGGAIVAKKALWAVAGLAVIAILVFVYYNGARSVNQGAEGTIAGANRAVGAQPSSVNAKTGDAQKFLQSDTFNRMMKSKDVRNLLANADFCALLANESVEAALRDGDVEAALKNPDVAAALADADVAAALQDSEIQAAMADAEVQAALRDETVQAALRDPDMEAALRDQDTRALLMNDEIQAALKNQAGLARLFADAEAALKGRALKGAQSALQAALQNKLFAALLSDGAFEAALKNQNGLMMGLLSDDTFEAALKSDGRLFASLLTDGAFEAALKNNAGLMMQLFASNAFEAALKDNGGAASLFGNVEFQSALKEEAFIAAIKDNGFQAALKNTAALQAALNKAY